MLLSTISAFLGEHGKENKCRYRRHDARTKKLKPGSSRRNVYRKKKRKTKHEPFSYDRKGTDTTESPLREDIELPNESSSDEEELLKLR